MELENVGPIKILKLNLFQRGLVLLCAENNDTTAADSNGSGKTWVLKGMSWVLFGTTVDSEKTDEVIRRGTTKARGSIVIHDGETEWQVIRTRTKSGIKVEILQDGVAATGAVIKDTQGHINKLLGMDFQTFRNTVMFGQGDTARFADYDTPDSERKAVLKRIMRVDVLDKASKAMSEKLKLILARKQELSRLVSIAEAKDPAELIASLVADISKLEGQKTEKNKQASRLASLETMEARIVTLLEGYDEKREEIAKLEVSKTVAQTEASTFYGERKTEAYKAAEANKGIALFAKGFCPVCTTPATGKHVKEHLDKLKQELAAAGKRVAELDASIKAAQTRAAEFIAGIQELEAAVADEKEWQSKLKSLREEIAAAKGATVEIKRIDGEMAEKAKKKSEATKSAKAVKGETAKHKTELVELEEQERHALFWHRGFSNQGMASFVLDSIIPELNARSNYWLNMLTDGDITVGFDTTSKLKSGEERDKMSMSLNVEGVEGVRPSGGQGNKVRLSGQLGLGDVVAAREHAALDIVCLDEVLDGLDASGKARVSDLLLELRKIRSTVLVVSHDPGIAEMFEAVVTLVKMGGETTLLI